MPTWLTPEKRPGFHARQAHQQVERKERDHRQQPQGEQVKRAFLVKPGIHLGQLAAKELLNAV